MSLQLIFGPMFSGKTTTLVALLNNYVSVGQNRVLYVNNILDTRQSSDGFISTHNAVLRVNNIDKCKVEFLRELDISKYDVIGVDEGQFFSDLVVTIRSWLDIGKIILVAGLDGDYRMQPFGEMCELICCAEQISKLCAFCQECLRKGRCNVPAPFTHRYISTDEQVKIGAAETYQALCRKCFRSKNGSE